MEIRLAKYISSLHGKSLIGNRGKGLDTLPFLNALKSKEEENSEGGLKDKKWSGASHMMLRTVSRWTAKVTMWQTN